MWCLIIGKGNESKRKMLWKGAFEISVKRNRLHALGSKFQISLESTELEVLEDAIFNVEKPGRMSALI